jgi:hypothetical protein
MPVMSEDSAFQSTLYLGLATAVATFAAAAVVLGLLTPRTAAGRFASVMVLSAAVLGITASFATLANQQPTATAHVAIGVGVLISGTYVLIRALMRIFEDRNAHDADLDGISMSPPAVGSPVHRVRRLRRGFLASTGAITLSTLGLLALTVPNLLEGIFSPPQREDVRGSGSRLASGESLATRRSLYSSNGRYELTMQPDGNLVLYRRGVGPIWQSETHGHPDARAAMETGGDLVVYDSANRALWRSQTSGNAGASLHVQDDGNAVIYSVSSRPLWSTGSAQGGAAAPRSPRSSRPLRREPPNANH